MIARQAQAIKYEIRSTLEMKQYLGEHVGIALERLCKGPPKMTADHNRSVVFLKGKIFGLQEISRREPDCDGKWEDPFSG